MIFAKDLILKGVAGLAVVGGLGAGGFYVWNQNKENNLETLAERVGLNCTGSLGDAGIDCSIKSGTDIKIKVKKDNTSFDVSSITGGKIKVYKTESSEDHHKGFKFVIEGGDITATDNSNKLEQFETYEIKEDSADKKYYLTRKTKVSDKIEGDLALPAGCKFSTESISCSNVEITSSNVGAINFVGKDANNQPQLTTGTATVTVTKETSNSDFPYGYKFSLKSKETSATITVGSTSYSLKQNQATEFRIKKPGEGNSATFSLEKAWTLETLTEKIGLECTASSGTTPTTTNGVECNKKANSGNIKVKQDTDTSIEVSSITGSGKIKVYKAEASENYNQGFKFVIEEADISASTNSKKLEEFETYEIKEEGGQWYLTRKEKAVDVKKKRLGLPDDNNCKLPEDGSTSTCNLNEAKIKAINFDGKNASGSYTANGNTTLKISKSSDTTTFPNGAYKFVFETNKDVIIPKTDGNITIKANTNTEFKIKKSGTSLSLEKAWTVTSLAEKVGLTCSSDNNTNKECTLGNGNINVHNGGNNKFQNLSKKGDGEKKVKFEEDKEGYNQGFKFFTEETGGITLQNGSADSDDNKKIEYKGNGDENSQVTYEIKETESTWYLTKKSPAA